MKTTILQFGFALTLLAAALWPAFADFRDVPEGSKYYEGVNFLQEKGIVQGYADGSFRPDQRINRYDFLKIIIESRFSAQEIAACPAEQNAFADVPQDHWCTPYLCLAKSRDIVKGYAGGIFAGLKEITLAEALKIILRCYGIETETEWPEKWQEPYMKKATELNLLEGISENPDYRITRGDMANLIWRLEQTGGKALSGYKTVLATVFWVGEGAEEDNGFISNVPSAWEGDWMRNFGGYDDPEKRCPGFVPCAFTPKQNPFYFALPYNDLDDDGNRKASAKLIPWYDEVKDRTSVVKNAWIEIKYNGRTAYAQWQDVGPFLEDDFDYVFGDGEPQNKQGVGAGLDVSPAVYDYLQMPTNVEVAWRFVKEKDVPDGPWKKIVTRMDAKW